MGVYLSYFIIDPIIIVVENYYIRLSEYYPFRKER